MRATVTQSRLKGLLNAGVSPWQDYIRRDQLTSGGLHNFITEHGVRGVTSNPAIFENAIAKSPVYDSQITHLKGAGLVNPLSILDEIMVDDIRMAADTLMPVYEATNGKDGYVSLEINPELAYDAAGTIAEGKRLYNLVKRPNLMLKVPATKEGLKAIEELTSEGMSVNVTLIFSVERYNEVQKAYIRGLESLASSSANGIKKLSKVASVASFFVSRVDSLIDPMIKESHPDLVGKSALANAQIAYALYEETFNGSKFFDLMTLGAQPQRLLWASTGTKKPEDYDLKYVEGAIGTDTVNTIPPKTLDAFIDHGNIPGNTLTENVPVAFSTIKRIGSSIDLPAAFQKLETDGVGLFVTAFRNLVDAVAKK